MMPPNITYASPSKHASGHDQPASVQPAAKPAGPRRAKVKPSAKTRRERSTRARRDSDSAGQIKHQVKVIKPAVIDRLVEAPGCKGVSRCVRHLRATLRLSQRQYAETILLEGGERVRLRIYPES